MSQNIIKFPNKEKPEFIKELREKVNDYFKENNISKYGNSSIVIKSVLMIALYIVPFILMLTGVVTSVFEIFICWIFMGIGMAGIGMGLMHDANHRTFSKNSTTNKWLSKSIYLLGGFPPTWRYQHNTLHHGFTNIDGYDEDISPIDMLRFSPNQPLQKIHRYQQWYAWGFYCLMTLAWATRKDFRQLLRYKKEEVPLSKNNKYNMLMVDLTISKILYYVVFLVVPIIALPIHWYLTLLFFFVMHFMSGLILSAIFQTAHVMPTSVYPLPDKEGNLEDNWAIHQLLTTTNYAPKSRIFSWLIGGLNYQVEHHLFPNISHVHYKKISQMVQDTTRKYNLPYYVQGNFLLAVYGHFKMLKMLGR